MKTTYINLLIALLTISSLFSCSNNPNSIKAIPNKTDVIGVIDVMSLYEKGELEELADMKLFKNAKKELRSENRKLSKLLNNMMEDPKSMGIDFRKDVFIYYINEAKDERYICYAMDLFSQENFSEFIDDVLNKMDVKYDIEEEKNYTYTLIEKGLGIGWDDEKAVFMIPENYKSRKNLDIELEEIFSLKEREQISNVPQFTQFYKNKKDLSFWFSTNLLENFREFDRIERELDFDITDIYLSTYLNFETDAISLKTQVTPNKEVTKMLDQNKIWDKDFNDDLLGYFPKQHFAVAGVSLDPIAYYNFIKDGEAYIDFESNFEKETNISIEDLISTLNGSAVFSLSDVKEFEYTYDKRVYNSYDYSYNTVETTDTQLLPVMGFAFDINDKVAIKKLLAEMPEDEINKHSNYYEFKLDGRYPVYFAFDDTTFYITNDKKAIKSFKDGEYDGETLSETDVKSDLNNNSLYGFMYLDIDKYPKAMKKEITKNYSAKEKKILNAWNEFAESLAYKQTDNMTYEIVFKTKKTGDNSLSNIIKTIDENSKTITSF